jgi:PAS domain S-box-containing protein
VNLSEETFEQLKNFYLKQMWEQIPVTYKEFPIITKTGGRKWVEQEATLIYKNGEVRGYQCVVKDITEKKLIAMELEQTQYRLQSILDFSPTIIFIKDVEGRYLLVNKRFEEMMHIRKDQILNKTDAELGTRPKSLEYTKADKEVITSRQPVTAIEVLNRDGKEYHYHFTKFPLLDKEQQVYGVCGMGIDITDRARYENELITARTAAEDARKTQEIFLANMSHEIRTPMNGIIGMTNLLLNAPLGAEQREFIDTIKQSASHLLVVVNEILDFSKIRSGKMMLEQIAFSLREVLDKTLFPLQHQAQEKDLSFYLEIEKAVPDQLLGDPVRLSQILVNLVENAIKFTPEGSVSLTVKLLETDNNRTRLYFEVSDTGIGIAADKQQMIFESFTQTSADNTRRFGGTGLGLPICKELIALQGGELQLISEEGLGSTFFFELSFTKSPFSQEAAPHEAAAIPPQTQVLAGISLLVIEDNEINRRVVFHTLRKAGAHVDMAFNGMEAIGYLEERVYDCVIMDIQMPGMDGYQTTARIREKGYDIPVIAMTASAIKGEREKCLQAGMNDYISKPFEPEELFRKILQHTGKQAAVHFSSPPPPLRQTAPVNGLVDFDHLRNLLFNDTAYMEEMLQEFLDTMPETARELQQAAERRQWDRVFFLSHRLKSSLGIVRISNAMELAKALEKDAQLEHNTDTIPGRVQQLCDLLLSACKEVASSLNKS